MSEAAPPPVDVSPSEYDDPTPSDGALEGADESAWGAHDDEAELNWWEDPAAHRLGFIQETDDSTQWWETSDSSVEEQGEQRQQDDAQAIGKIGLKTQVKTFFGKIKDKLGDDRGGTFTVGEAEGAEPLDVAGAMKMEKAGVDTLAVSKYLAANQGQNPFLDSPGEVATSTNPWMETGVAPQTNSEKIVITPADLEPKEDKVKLDLSGLQGGSSQELAAAAYLKTKGAELSPDQGEQNVPFVEKASSGSEALTAEQEWYAEKKQQYPDISSIGEMRERVAAKEADDGLEFGEYSTVAEALEKQGYVKRAPRVAEQAQQLERDNKLTYYDVDRATWGDDIPGNPMRVVSEGQGLQELLQFARHAEEVIGSADSAYMAPEVQARRLDFIRGLQEDLTFIGEREYEEAAAGLAELWKNYLAEDDSRQLCVLSDLIQKTSHSSKRKSDSYLYERVLDHFSEEELEQLGDRIIADPEDLTADPEDVRIVLLDDWTISGSQMQSAYRALQRNPELSKYIDSVEANLLVASANRLRDGISVEGYDAREPHSIPVRGYFASHYAEASGRGHGSLVTGSHSSVDFDFEQQIDRVLRSVNMLSDGEYMRMPPPANIKRPYREMPYRYERVVESGGRERIVRREDRR